MIFDSSVVSLKVIPEIGDFRAGKMEFFWKCDVIRISREKCEQMMITCRVVERSPCHTYVSDSVIRIAVPLPITEPKHLEDRDGDRVTIR